MKTILLIIQSVLLLLAAKAQSDNLYKEVNLDSVFAETSGSFVLYDLQADEYSVYNNDTAQQKFRVHSTSKIFWTIIALEEGIIETEDEVVVWDSLKYPRQNIIFENFYQNQTIVSALKYSVNWYYMDLLSRMTPEMAEEYLNRLEYQEGFQVEKLHYFGLTFNIFKSAFDQVEFLKNIYLNNYQLSEYTIDILKKGMLAEQTDNYNLYARTGLGPLRNGEAIGWLVGFVEKNGSVYFYALNLLGTDELKLAKSRKTIALESLKVLGVID